jgi:hypothetical protein
MSRRIWNMRTNLCCLALFYAAVAAVPSTAAAQNRQLLDHVVYEAWDTIGGESISSEGRWALYNRLRYDRDDVLVVRSVAGETTHVFDRATGARFDESSRSHSR